MGRLNDAVPLEWCRAAKLALGRPLRVVKKMRGFFFLPFRTIAHSDPAVGNVHYRQPIAPT